MEKLKEESSNPIGEQLIKANELVESLHSKVKLKLKRQAHKKLEEEKSNELLKKIIKSAEKLSKNIDKIINELTILRKLKKKEN